MACHLVWAATATALRPSALPARLPATLRPLHAQRVVTMAEAEATASTGSLPPDSFQELISHAAESTVLAISEGSRLIEVEFPPIPVSKLDDPGLRCATIRRPRDGRTAHSPADLRRPTARSAYDVLSANLRLCIEYCKKLQGPDGPTGGKPIAITLPDAAELRRSQGYLGTAEPWPNVRLNSLGGDTAPSNPLAGVFGSIFKAGGAVDAVVAEWAGMYVLVGQSCQELPTIRALHEKAPDVPIVCFNLKLDTLRGDLGLPAFPSRDVHHTFLCKCARPPLGRVQHAMPCGGGGGGGGAAWGGARAGRRRPDRTECLSPPSSPRAGPLPPRQGQARLLHAAAVLLALAVAGALPHVLLGRALPPLPRGLADAARPRHGQVVPAGQDAGGAPGAGHLQGGAHREPAPERRGGGLCHLAGRLQAEHVVGGQQRREGRQLRVAPMNSD